MRRATLVSTALVMSLASVFVGSPTSAQVPGRSVAAASTATTTRYVPLEPCRLADTRDGTGLTYVDGKTARISIDACGIPPDAAAIVATTTVVNTVGTGYLVVHPTGIAPPNAATLAWNGPSTRGNSSTIAVGAGGAIDLFRPRGFDDGNVTVDVVGAFVPATSATAGRFVPEPTGRRLIDTRDTQPLGAGDSIVLARPDGVPDDATALAITTTAVSTAAPGFFTVHAAGAARPVASMLNVEGSGIFRAASTIVPLGEEGFELFSSGGSDVVVDMTGWFTGESADSSADGLFVPIAPVRLTDTRPRPRPIHPDGTIEIPLPGGLTNGVQSGPPAAVAIAMSMVGPRRQGFITSHAARSVRGAIASGFAQARETASQFAFTPSSSLGISVYSSAGTELTVDLFGWFTGAAAPTDGPVAVNPVPRQRVLAVGDSSMAGVDRTFANRALQGADFDFRARSCRRLVRVSCSGREGPIPPPTALDTINSVPVDVYDVLVVMTGYNDTMPNFASAVPTIVAAARQKGIRRIVWLTMAREFRTDKGGPGAFQVYQQHNQVIRANAASHDFMYAIEWSSIVRQVPFWTYSDGIHLDRPGGYGAADLISRSVAHVTGQSCPQPETPGGPTNGVCPDPGTRAPVDVRAIYGF